MSDLLTTSTRDTLAGWSAPDAEQDALRHSYLAFVDAAANPCERACVPGHVTASAVVFDADGSHVLLTLHPRVGKWVQLGGHCEPADESIAAAALREATEESGLDGLTLSPAPVHLHTRSPAVSVSPPVTSTSGTPRSPRPPPEPVISEQIRRPGLVAGRSAARERRHRIGSGIDHQRSRGTAELRTPLSHRALPR